MLLPKQKRGPKMVNPKSMLLFGQPKTGKTSIVASLDNCLIVDMEKGSLSLEAMSVEVNNMADFNDLIKALKQAKEDNGGKNPYRIMAIDTLTALEEISISYARQLYNQTPMGINFKGDVRTLPQGAGYLYTRKAMKNMVNMLNNYCDTLILIGHVKEKDILKNGETLSQQSIHLTGKLKDWMCGWVDTIGLVYREDNFTKINFAPSDDLIVGSRQRHLIGQTITVAVSDPNTHELTIDWSKIFLPEKTEE